MGLATLLGWRKLGYFIPYRYAGGITMPKTYPALEPFFEAARPSMEAIIDAATKYLPEIEDLSRAPHPKPRLSQDWFPTLDAVAAYTIVRTRTPEQVFEVGAGHSTRWFALAAQDVGTTKVTTIDPQPRADLSGFSAVTIHPRLLSDVEPAFWDQVGEGDVVSLDGSHILMPGTDVDLLLTEILPRVQNRALLHIHDICLPDAYPASWDWRGYNEQNAVAGLIASGAYDVLWSSHYVRTRMAERLGPLAALPFNEGAIETSLWLTPR